MNLARLNHILIPSTRDGRERIRRSLVGRAAAPFWWLYAALSDEGRTLSVLMLFIGTAGLSVDTTLIYVLWSALVGLVIAGICVRPAFHMRGISLDARAPHRVAVGEAATFELVLTNSSRAPIHDVRIAGPFLPWDGHWVARSPSVAVIPQGGSARVEARARFVARGEHQLDNFSAARLVPGGLAVGPSIRSHPVRFLVVPTIAKLARFDFVPRVGGASGAPQRAVRTGESLELFAVRPYRRGDPIRDLHPKTWARRGEPHVREYRDAPSLQVGVIVDDDPRTASEDAYEAALSLAAGVVAQACRGDARIDGVVLGTRFHSLGPRGGGVLEQVLDALATAERNAATDRVRFWREREPWLRRLSMVVVISTGSDLRRRELLFELTRRQHSVRLLRVFDGRSWFGADAHPRAIGPEESVVTVRAVKSRRAVVL